MRWLDKYNVTNYKLIPDEKYGYKVNAGYVYLFEKGLDFIPVKFNEVISLSCLKNQLTSLEFCPDYVGQDFLCSYNKLTTLKFAPKHVEGMFYCNNNQLISLEFCPEKVGGDFNCSSNQLTDLQFCPKEVVGKFICHTNYLAVHEITDFKEIYKIHQSHVKIMPIYDKLNSDLKINSTESVKVKI